MAQVVLEGVTKRFGDVVAVDDLTLTADDEEFLVLLGPSGCGKSTALRIVAGLEQPTAGTVRIGARVVNDIEARARDVSMVFQTYALYPHMSVRRNIEFPLKARGMERQERAARVHEAARGLGLEALLDRKPAQLSGGQRQRVALARAIVRRPAAFLMDEPLSNLDAKLRVQTRAELIELHQRLAATVLYVTHDQVEAMTMGHRIAIMDQGVLQQVGPPQAVYDEPANLFVAQFIGSPSMNTVPARVVSEAEGLAVDLPGARVALPPAVGAAVSRADVVDVVLGVRPEHLRIDGGPLPATIMVVESLGHERHVVCRLDDGTMIIVRQPSGDGSGSDGAPRDGNRIGLSLPAERLHLFDAASGKRVPV